MSHLILASGSPRRRELLSLYTTDFTVCASDFDESAVTADTPAELVEMLARGKCRAVSAQHPGAVVIGCDTVVDVKGEVFGKPHSVEDARRMLRALSGAVHEVHTGVCISDGTRTESFVDTCRVKFFPISEAEIERYAATEEPYDKAGAYAIQGRAPSGWTASRATITPSWGCPSAAPSGCWSDFKRPGAEIYEKIRKNL